MMTNVLYATFDTNGLPTAFMQSAAYDAGWTPPTNALELTEAQFLELFNNQGSRRWSGLAVEPYSPPAVAPIMADYTRAIASMMDETAKSHQYDGALSLSTYVNSTNPTWSAEATAFVAWRDAVWAYAYAELAKVQTGQQTQPAVIAFLAELPVIAWPA